MVAKNKSLSGAPVARATREPTAAARERTRGGRTPRGTQAAPGGTQWTFLTNHAHVLILLALNEGKVLREIAVRVGITERAVQNIISELSDAGFLARVKVGRKNSYKLYLERPLRHPIERHRRIGDLVRLIRDVSLVN